MITMGSNPEALRPNKPKKPKGVKVPKPKKAKVPKAPRSGNKETMLNKLLKGNL